jgi:hypothetical protein
MTTDAPSEPTGTPADDASDDDFPASRVDRRQHASADVAPELF